MKQLLFMAFTALMVATASAYAASPDDILGLWNTAERDARIEIYKCGKKYCGKIVWLQEPAYPHDSKEGTPGTPMLDHNNPDPALRRNPLIGLPILLDFVFAGDHSWSDGKIYDAESGRTYSGKMRLISRNQLYVRGFIGLSILGGSTTWTRQAVQVLNSETQ